MTVGIEENLMFSSVFWKVNILDVIDNDKLVDYAYDISMSQKSVKVSNRLGYHSPFLNTVKDVDRRYKPLVDEVASLCRTICNEKLFRDMREEQIFTLESWLNINKKYSYNTSHIHGGDCLLSLVYYAQVPENSGHLYFEMDKRDSDCVDKFGINKYLPILPKVSFLPEKGDLVCFPSWINHGVEQNLSDEERISFAFNMKLYDARKIPDLRPPQGNNAY